MLTNLRNVVLYDAQWEKVQTSEIQTARRTEQGESLCVVGAWIAWVGSISIKFL